ncbi:unnamed protein product [Mytilus edulis]|uniref:Uncharacterized protein n=1 Tax=Mytilus edulis TaxID=6550 RepID=A0A8S3THS9_MYTED|nr:unnamed protein product [Mytilus edulis]
MRLLQSTGTFKTLSVPFIRDEIKYTCIHSSNRNEIIVGFTNYGVSAGIVELCNIGCRYGIDKTMRRVECDIESDKALFQLPEKISTISNGFICVIDRLKSGKSRVVVIGKWGEPKWTYSGYPSINSVIEFSPNDITTTSSGLVQFICNLISGSVITNPVSICFDKKGQLMIGCAEPKKTKLHIVNLMV